MRGHLSVLETYSVSLLAESATQIQLAPFFPDTAEEMVRSIGVTDDFVPVEDDVSASIDITSTGDTVRQRFARQIGCRRD